MAFLKTCYECGAREEKLYDGKCEDCFKKACPPIEEVKPINIKYCNTCKKIHYQNQLITREELIERLPDIARRNTVIDKHYSLNYIELENVEIKGDEVSFDITAHCSLK